jgi:hypothetical protein
MHAMVGRDLRTLQREGVPWAAGFAHAVAAGLAANLVQQRDAIAHMTEAVAAFDHAEMRLYSAVARRRLGEWRGGAEGAAMVAAADEWMRSQGVRKPERLTWALCPGGIHDPWKDTSSVSGQTRRTNPGS